MNPVKIRDIEIGGGIPKICVPIVGETREEIVQYGAHIAKLDVDIVEWRADWYKDIFDLSGTEETLKALRKAVGNKVLLFTFRTSREGGEKTIGIRDYTELLGKAAQSGYVDLIDAEAFTEDSGVQRIVETAHKRDVKVMASSHDFQKTPPKEQIAERLCRMHKMGADIAKIAVMPTSKKDVFTLLEASQMTAEYAPRPIVTISMGKLGIISRLCPETFGCAITFASLGRASAPGQIDAKELRTVLDIIHKTL